jgi:protein tyrosine/serine phosphatase
VPVDRVLTFSTVFNFRDLGGYATGDGRTVRTGRVYRSDGLFRLVGDDLERFAAIGVRTVLDLRRPDELECDGRYEVADGVTYHHVCFQVDPWPPASDLTDETLPRYLADRYLDMAEAALTGEVPVGRCLRLLADASHVPVVFHCAAGKDRTGVLAALTLSLLGVPDDTVADDYARSGEAERQFWAWRARVDPALDPPVLADEPAPRKAMLLFLAELRERHGSVEAYAARAGVDARHVAALRAHLLD